MKLSELAFACYIYSRMSNYDSAYRDFLKNTHPAPDLRLAEHRIELLKWLNKWGCRQFATDYRNLASDEIKVWYEECNAMLSSPNKTLLELSDSEIASTSIAYERLADRTASKRNVKNKNAFIVLVGPTGAAKILFAIRPKALLPWDEPIRRKFRLDGSSNSYVTFLGITKEKLEALDRACRRNGYDLSNLPKVVGRPGSSLVKLIDEYLWVTITKRCPLPPGDTLSKWATWQ